MEDNQDHLDVISILSNDLIHDLFAFLSTKQVVETSTLSRRFQNVWKSVPCLNLDTSEFLGKEDDFINFVEKFLNLRDPIDLKEFKLMYGLDFKLLYGVGAELETHHPLKEWIETATNLGLKHLHISSEHSDFVYPYICEIPEKLMLCRTLVVLELHSIILNMSEGCYLPLVKIMILAEVQFADDLAFQTLISRCPVLEDLSVIRSMRDHVEMMNVSSPTLKTFVVAGDYWAGGAVSGGIVIDSPCLEYLSLVDDDSANLVLNGLPSLKEAKIDVSFGTQPHIAYDVEPLVDIINQFLLGISNAKSLIFGPDIVLVLSEFLELESLPQMHGVTHLSLELGFNGWELLPALLLGCPNLKSIKIEAWTKPGEAPELPISAACLMSLEYVSLATSFIGDEAEMCLLRYFLENGAALREVTIHLVELSDLSLELLQETLDLLKEILTFPRRSSGCRLFIK